MRQLRSNVMSGLSNPHNIITVVVFSLSGMSFIIFHFISIFNNRNIQQVSDKDDLLPPASILYFALVLTFWSFFGFCRNPALKKFGIKTVKSYFTTNTLRSLERNSDQRLFQPSKVGERKPLKKDCITVEDIE